MASSSPRFAPRPPWFRSRASSISSGASRSKPTRCWTGRAEPMNLSARGTTQREERPLDVGAAGRVSALLLAPATPHALLVLGHGAGAGMEHPFMEMIAARLAAGGVATLRYQFPYMERGEHRTD